MPDRPPADLALVLRQLYAAEINVTIASLYDAGWVVTLGGPASPDAERTFGDENFDSIADWLIEVGCLCYPRSTFALAHGKRPAND